MVRFVRLAGDPARADVAVTVTPLAGPRPRTPMLRLLAERATRRACASTASTLREPARAAAAAGFGFQPVAAAAMVDLDGARLTRGPYGRPPRRGDLPGSAAAASLPRVPPGLPGLLAQRAEGRRGSRRSARGLGGRATSARRRARPRRRAVCATVRLSIALRTSLIRTSVCPRWPSLSAARARPCSRRPARLRRRARRRAPVPRAARVRRSGVARRLDSVRIAEWTEPSLRADQTSKDTRVGLEPDTLFSRQRFLRPLPLPLE